MSVLVNTCITQKSLCSPVLLDNWALPFPCQEDVSLQSDPVSDDWTLSMVLIIDMVWQGGERRLVQVCETYGLLKHLIGH